MKEKPERPERGKESKKIKWDPKKLKPGDLKSPFPLFNEDELPHVKEKKDGKDR